MTPEETVREALRIKSQHADGGTCPQCGPDGCLELLRIQGLIKPGEL
ncbi:hypothetical protein BDK92_5849 [Micromonospora pisi]|uniref:Uncharacterized protein n=1 Tax=Micromonospora pisi TaxID=589240 RepID=A0A495JR58_9ACTN|nr:hypothetical protein [Micromonospora pisi]RKR91453.1 hypothetical protein BDK92_5849 [Micromonospora pisi]